MVDLPRLTQHLIVVSFDALGSPDFDFIRTLPNFKAFLEHGSYCDKVYSVYPTLTYPAHTSIITGRYPRDHGIINNTLLQPNRKSPDWYWQRKYIKGETLYDQAIDQGLKVAALLWPVTARSRIQYNLPEIFANRPWQNQIAVSLFNGSLMYQWKLNQMFGHLRKGLSQPELDHFVHQSLLFTLSQYKPDLTLVHYSDLDSQKHRFGTRSPQAYEAMKRFDQKLGDIIQVLKMEKMYDQSTLILLGDHGALDENKVVYINAYLHQKGFITLANGKIKSWRAIMKNCDGGSCYIYLKEKSDVLKNEVAAVLKELKDNDQYGIEAVYSAQEAKDLGADPECDFMLEAMKGFTFKEGINNEVLMTFEGDGARGHYPMAVHGYSPFKPDYTTVFMASGPGIVPQKRIEEMRLIDEAPIMAELLGLKLKEAEGRVIEGLIDYGGTIE